MGSRERRVPCVDPAVGHLGSFLGRVPWAPFSEGVSLGLPGKACPLCRPRGHLGSFLGRVPWAPFSKGVSLGLPWKACPLCRPRTLNWSVEGSPSTPHESIQDLANSELQQRYGMGEERTDVPTG